MARLYSPAKEQALVFFRHGVPLLFSGLYHYNNKASNSHMARESDENDIYGFFEKNQSPAVKELTDKIFEHITQAATGATTGDWFAKKTLNYRKNKNCSRLTDEHLDAILRVSKTKMEADRLHAAWEGVGATLRGRVNVARIDSGLAGVNTAKRDEIVDWSVSSLKIAVAYGQEVLAQHPWIWQIGVASALGFGLVAITALIALVKAGRNKPAKEIKKEKKRK
ncbi:Transmembrane protein [Operophtera brumata]|uniref:Transmembrane protein n=1 Tax=Operophtera brumata TaxID=104452 RepID=A0A0L7KT88_OPEBR|nr:Transmembrane protein [Operophtera brumata]